MPCDHHDGTNQGVAQLFKTKFKAASGLEAHTVCRTSISDEAAAGANMLLLTKTSDTSELVDGDLLDAEVDGVLDPAVMGGRCNMHRSDKVGAGRFLHWPSCAQEGEEGSKSVRSW